MFDYRALYEIQLQVSVDFLRVVQYYSVKTYMASELVKIMKARDEKNGDGLNL